MEKAACVYTQQACLLQCDVQTPPSPPLWLRSSPALESGYYTRDLFPKEGGCQVTLLALFQSAGREQ